MHVTYPVILGSADIIKANRRVYKMPQTFTFENLSKDNIKESSVIVYKAFNKYSAEKNEPSIPDPSIVEGRLNEYISDTGIPSLFFGGYLDGRQISFMMIRKLGMDDESWEIQMLSVDPEYQRQGYGRKMIENALLEILAQKGVLALCAVTENNDVALKLFADAGFECEASGIQIAENMFIWMLRKDMKNQMAEEAAKAEREAEKKALEGTEEIKITM